MNRLPADVAHEVATHIAQAGVVNPHTETVEYVTKLVRISLLQDSIAWMKFMSEVA